MYSPKEEYLKSHISCLSTYCMHKNARQQQSNLVKTIPTFGNLLTVFCDKIAGKKNNEECFCLAPTVHTLWNFALLKPLELSANRMELTFQLSVDSKVGDRVS